MASKVSVSSWLAERFQDFAITYTELTWGRSLIRPMFDFEVAGEALGRKFVGRGTDFVEGLALEKASAEFLERVVCAKFEIPTDGVALHTDPHLACISAKLEAKERYLLNWRLQNRIPFGESIKSSLLPELQSSIDKLSDGGASLALRSLNAGSGEFGAIAKINFLNHAFIGAAVTHSNDQSVQGASVEAMRNLAAFVADPAGYREEIRNNRQLWIGNGEYLANYSSLFEYESHAIAPDADFAVEEMGLGLTFGSDELPFSVYRAVRVGADT